MSRARSASARSSRGAVSGNLADIVTGTPELLKELESGISFLGDDATVANLAGSPQGPMAIAAAIVHGNSGQASIPREQRRILWLARKLDDNVLAAVASRFQLPKPELVDVAVAGHDTMKLVDAAGTHIATISWQPRRPGDPAFAHAAAVASVVMLVIGALVFIVLAAFRHAIKLRAAADERDWLNARYDAISGELNRFGFEEHLAAQVPRKRGELPAAFCQLFVEDSVAVVGLYGREVTNQLLAALATRFRAVAGDNVVVSRTGPAEYTIAWLGDGASAAAHSFADRILVGLSEPVPVGDLKLKIALSIGIVEAEITHDNVGSILRRAETAVARARETGGSQAVDYDPRIEDERRRRIEMQADIRRGLDAGEFDLVYQPIIDFRAEAIIGVEALMRWTRRAAGPMGPGEFIPAAEASGLIDDLGMFALRRAVEEIGPLGNIKISVNVSTAQLKNPALPQTVFTALEEWGVDPARLQLEVTESFLVSHPDRAIRLIEQLRQAGILIALDDFGTGYSSIGYLRQFRFDRVKLDRSLIDHIDEDPVQAALVEIHHGLRLRDGPRRHRRRHRAPRGSRATVSPRLQGIPGLPVRPPAADRAAEAPHRRPAAGAAAQGQLTRRPALGAAAAQLDRGALEREAVLAGPAAQPLRHRRLGELVDPTAARADGEGRGAGALVAAGIGAADEGVERFQPVRQAVLDQLVERAIDLQRRAQPVVAQLVENVVGRERRLGMVQRLQHQVLVARQVARALVVMVVVTMRHDLGPFVSAATAARAARRKQ